MTTPDTRDPARREMGLRSTSEQVANILRGWENAPTPVFANICRDWLDMAAVISLIAAAGWVRDDYEGNLGTGHHCMYCGAEVHGGRHDPTCVHYDECVVLLLAALTTGGDS